MVSNWTFICSLILPYLLVYILKLQDTVCSTSIKLLSSPSVFTLLNSEAEEVANLSLNSAVIIKKKKGFINLICESLIFNIKDLLKINKPEKRIK